MQFPEATKSVTVSAGTRIYHLDAYTDPKGNPYLTIKEVNIDPRQGQRESQRIFIFDEDLDKFAEAFGEMVQHIRGE